MGVLVGTSLIVIIPEGVDTLYSAQPQAMSHMRRHLPDNNIETQWPGLDTFVTVKRETADVDSFLTPGPVIADKVDKPPKTPTNPGVVGIMDDDSGDKKEVEVGGEEKKHEHLNESQHAWIGIALISGFILMYLIDRLPHYVSATKRDTRPYHISLSNLGRRFNHDSSAENESESFIETRNESHSKRRSFATTTGLVIHAAADGIALGASSSAATTGLSFIIFFAIMVHKAPAAFGLTSVLLKQGLSTRAARSHLLLFSLAAPAGALITWLFAHAVGAGGAGNVENTKWWTGMLLLFSGGTFLYVAMHTMQENSPDHEHQPNGQGNGAIDGRDTPKHERSPLVTDLFGAIFGMILPLFLQVGHAH